jgi:hypothetical protein
MVNQQKDSRDVHGEKRVEAFSGMPTEARVRMQAETRIPFESVDGIYAVYLTGLEGPGFALIYLGNGKIVGADAGGVALDGRYTMTNDKSYAAEITVKTPPNMTFLQGGFSGPGGEVFDINFILPGDFYSIDYVRIETPRGPINAKFARLRGLDE